MRKLLNSELGRKSIEQFRKSEKLPLIIVLDNVRSHNNVGSIFRSADAFLISKICLCGITAKPPHRNIRKTALGATESVIWNYYTETMDAICELKDDGYIIIAVEQAEGSVKLQDLKVGKEEKYALVFGHEVNGVNQKVLDQCDMCVEIPQFGTKHSFNIAVSAGILLWEFYRKGLTLSSSSG